MTAATMTEHAPFRADQVGSLLRPPELKAARERRAKGELSAAALAEIEDRLIRAAIKMQEEVGLRAITDGDFRRQSWSSDFLCAIKGVVQAPPPPRLQQEDAPVGGIVRDWQPPTPKVVSKLEWPNGGITRKAFQFLAGATTRTPKVTIPSPSMLHFRGGRGGVDQTAYPDMEDFFADLIGVYRAEIMDLAAAGCRYVQLDDTNLAYLCDPRLRDRVKGLGEDPDRLPHLYARLINGAIADRPRDMKITVHLCRGNSLSRGHAEGGYEPVADAMFNELNVDGFFLEYDDARSGDFAPLAVRAQRQPAHRARGHHLEVRCARIEGSHQTPDRGGVEIHAARSDLPQSAMWVREPHRRKPAHGRRSARQASPRGRDCAGDLATRVAAQAPPTCSIRRSGLDGAELDRHATWPSGRTSTSRR